MFVSLWFVCCNINAMFFCIGIKRKICPNNRHRKTAEKRSLLGVVNQIFDETKNKRHLFCNSKSYNHRKYKALILKHKAHILKYMACIFYNMPYVFFAWEKDLFETLICVRKSRIRYSLNLYKCFFMTIQFCLSEYYQNFSHIR